MSIKNFFRNVGHVIAFPFVAISLYIGLSKSKGLYKRYISEPESILETERYEYVYKQVSKATFIANCKINVYGIEKVPNLPVMFICNHKSGFDPLLLLKIFSKEEKIVRPVFVSKKELLDEKKISNAAKLIDTIFIDRKNIRNAIQCLEEEKRILAKRSIVVFIEGTRILSKEFGEFKAAALDPAYKTMRHIVPVVIHGSIGVEKENKKGFFKYNKINIKFMNPLKYNDFIPYSRDAIADKLKHSMYEEYMKFEEKNPLDYSNKNIFKKIKSNNEEKNDNLLDNNVYQAVEKNKEIYENKIVEKENLKDESPLINKENDVVKEKPKQKKKKSRSNTLKKPVQAEKKVPSKKLSKQNKRKKQNKIEKIVIPKSKENSNKKVPSKFDF